MRKPEYISPTSFMLWEKDRDDWYKQYASIYRIPRPPQTMAMSIGSAFDAYVKSALFKILYPDDDDPKFVFQTLFEKQVEAHNREWALVHGEYAFEQYKKLGAFDDLLASMRHANSNAKFEADVQGPIGPMVLMGKPDAWFFNKQGHPIILDWKVNGYCAKGNKSPEKGFYNMRTVKGQSQHKDCYPMDFKGTMINGVIEMQDVSKDWATQISIYAWLCGAPIGSPFVCAIDQLACSNSGTEFPDIRVAEHRCIVGEQFQLDMYKRLCDMWDRIQNEHIFSDLSFAESQERQRHLDEDNVHTHRLITSTNDRDRDVVAFLGLNEHKMRF